MGKLSPFHIQDIEDNIAKYPELPYVSTREPVVWLSMRSVEESPPSRVFLLNPLTAHSHEGLQGIFSDREFSTILQAYQHGQPGSGLANKFIMQWITKHPTPTWEGLVGLLGVFGAYHAAREIESIIPTISSPALEHVA